MSEATPQETHALLLEGIFAAITGKDPHEWLGSEFTATGMSVRLYIKIKLGKGQDPEKFVPNAPEAQARFLTLLLSEFTDAHNRAWSTLWDEQ